MRRRTAALVLLAAGAGMVSGARFPDSVERTFVFRGESAREVASLLGLGPGGTRDLRLGPNDEWAALLRERPNPYATEPHPTPPPRFVRAARDAAGTVTLSGSWLDSTTGSSPHSPRYLAGSVFVADGADGPWADLVGRLVPEKERTAEPVPGGPAVAERTVREDGRTVFEVRVWRVRDGATGRTGFLAGLGAEPR